MFLLKMKTKLKCPKKNCKGTLFFNVKTGKYICTNSNCSYGKVKIKSKNLNKMENLQIKYKNLEMLTKTVELPYFMKNKLMNQICKVLSVNEAVFYYYASETSKGIHYTSTHVIDFNEYTEITESEFEAVASIVESHILAKLTKK